MNHQLKTIRPYLLIWILVSASLSIWAQAQQTSYQVFKLDSLSEIELQLYGEYQVETWAADNLMTQSTIKLYNASEGILQHFVDNNRYAIRVDTLGSRLRLVSEDKERKTIKTRAGSCFEVVELIVYLPEEFEPGANGIYLRRKED